MLKKIDEQALNVHSSETATPEPSLSRPASPRRHLWMVISTALGLALMGAILTQVSLESLIAVLVGAEWRYLAVVFVVSALLTAARATRLVVTLYPEANWLPCYGISAYVRGLNYVMPFRTAEFVFLAMLKRRKLIATVSEALPAWAVLRASDVAGLATCFVLLMQMTLLHESDQYGAAFVATTLVIVTVLLVATIAVSVRYVPMIGNAEPETWLARRWESLKNGVARFRSPTRLALVFFLGIVVWSLNIGVFTAAAVALDASHPVHEYAFAMALALAIQLLPIRPPLGIGTSDAVFLGCLMLIGFGRTEAATMAIGLRVAQTLVVAIDYFVGVVILSKSVSKVNLA